MRKKKRRKVGEYAQKLKALELERFLKKKDKGDPKDKPKKKRRKKKKTPKPKSAWKVKYYKYLESDEWTQIRMDIINDRKCCERCESKNNLVVHHKNYDNVFHEEPGDLELLCKECHEKEHGIKN